VGRYTLLIYIHIGQFGDHFTGTTIQPTKHSTQLYTYRSVRGPFYGYHDSTNQTNKNSVTSRHWRTIVSQPDQGPIPPGSAH